MWLKSIITWFWAGELILDSLSGQCNHEGPYKGNETGKRQRRWCEGRSRGQGDAATPKEGGQRLGGERSRGMGPPLQAPKGTQPCGPLHFSLCNWLWTSDLQNYKRINVCCFKSQSLCFFITVATGSYYIPQWCLLWHKWQGKPDGTQLQYLPRNPRVRHLLNQLDRIAPFVLHVEIC